jgi:hypothetical protein
MKKPIQINVTINKIKSDSKKFKIDRKSDHSSYSEFVAYFKKISKINRHNMIIGINFVYGWMPTIFEFKQEDDKKIKRAVQLLNKVKNKTILDANELNFLKSLFNNSLVGTSKLLHFICPQLYPIWDSRVYFYLTDNKAYAHSIGNCDTYLQYLNLCHDVVKNKNYNEIHNLIVKKIGYPISNMRSIELIMFSSGKIKKNRKPVKVG